MTWFRLTLTPDRRDTCALPPIAYALKPRRVLDRMKKMNRTQMPKIIPGHARPVPSMVKTLGKIDMSLPAPTMRDAPLAIIIIPMVAMKAGTPVVTMIAPFTRPAECADGSAHDYR